MLNSTIDAITRGITRSAWEASPPPLRELKHCPHWDRQQNSFTAPDAESFGREPGYAFGMVMDGPTSVEVDQGGQARAPRSRFWRDALRRRLLALADLIAAAAASVVVASSSADAFWALALLPAWILIAKLLGLYDRDHASIRHLTFDELPAIAAWAGAGVALLALVLPQTPAGAVAPRAAVAAPRRGGGALLLRAVARWLWRRLTPPRGHRGASATATSRRCRRKLELFPDMHLSLRRRRATGARSTS